MKEGDLLIQSDKIIGFLKGAKPDENLIVFYRVPALFRMKPDDLTSAATASSSSTPLFSRGFLNRRKTPRRS